MIVSLLRDRSIVFKVALAPTLAILCLAAVGAIGLFANSRLTASLTHVGEITVPSIVKVESLAASLIGIHAQVNQSLAWEGAGFKEDKIKKLDGEINAKLRDIATALDNVAADKSLSDDDRAMLDKAKAEYKKYASNARSALDIKSGMVANAASYMTTMEESYSALTGVMSVIVKSKTEEAKAIEIARAVDGVRDVKSTLQIES